MIQRLTPPSFIPLLIAGAIHALSFAPAPLPTGFLPFVQLLSFTALLFFTLKASSTKTALWGAWAFGLANFGVGVYWLYISLHQYGGLAPSLAVLALFAFAAGLALFYMLAIGLMRFFIPQPKQLSWQQQLGAALVIASAWVLIEWVRGTFLSGFPWLNIAYAHVDGMFAGWAPIFGSYGVAWFAAFTSATLAIFALNTRQDAPKQYSFPLGIAAVFALAGVLLGGIEWHRAHGDTFFVRLAQGNVEQSAKFDPNHLQDGVNLYKKLAAVPPKSPEAKPDLIVLPETIVPLFQHQWQTEFWQEWIDIATEQDATILLGAPLYAQHGGQGIYTNSAITIDAHSSATAIQQLQMAQRYDKHHLVPFGEFIPPGFHWFIELMNIPLGEFNRGNTRQANFTLGSQWIGPNICYEDTFGEEIIQGVRDSEEHGPGATLLVNLSNLAWFGDTWALRQHLQIARMRSIETARPTLRATNTGVTATIFPNGKVQALLPTHTIGVLDVEIQGTTGQTPYVSWSNWPAIIWSLLLLVFVGRALRSSSQRSIS